MKAGRALRVGSSLGLLALMWAPLVVLVLYSFNAARLGSQWRGATLEWYAAALRNEAILSATANTLMLGLASALVSTVLGTMLGYGTTRVGRRAQPWQEWMLRLPTVVPDIVSAVSLVMFFSWARRWVSGLEPGMLAMMVGHVGLQVPFVALVVRARAVALDPMLAEAARDLGATPGQVFRHVTLPALMPGIVAGALLGFTLSLDDFAISFFNGGPGSTTLPVWIYASARRGVTPEVNAISALLLGATVMTVVAGLRLHASRMSAGRAGAGPWPR